MRIRVLGCALASAACLLLTACSHPQLMDPGMTESQVRTELGAPHAAVDTGKGTQRWVYSMQRCLHKKRCYRRKGYAG